MTFDELMAAQKKAAHTRKRPTDEEHRIQCECVRWFSLQYPRLHGRLFAVPNGGRRDATTAAKLKAEGVVAGVADLILLKSNRDYGALLIEMKTRKGRQRDSQKQWENTVCADSEYKYVVCRSFDDFKREVDDYLKNE
ncbi:MAG: VRR-NUC domain-containing protein [Alistipes sp.]|nr:VRR-NUC domain-containing protein [Alistipes sp.]